MAYFVTQKIIKKKPIEIITKEMYRDYTYIEDVVKIASLMNKPQTKPDWKNLEMIAYLISLHLEY